MTKLKYVRIVKRPLVLIGRTISSRTNKSWQLFTLLTNEQQRITCYISLAVTKLLWTIN